MELTPFIKKDGVIPIYLQLYYFFRDEIEQGRLTAGAKLPSIRQLSRSLNISRNTVEFAYQQLIAEGYVESKEKSGLYVLKLEYFRMEHNKILKDAVKPTKGPDLKRVIDFQYGDIELDRFPLKVWKKCLLETMDTAKQEVFSYGDKKGHLGLRSEIAGYLQKARGVNCDASQIVLCAGTQTSITLLCQLLSLTTKEVAMENPGYDGVRFVFESHGCNLIPISLESDGINIDELEGSSAKCAYVTPSHQFPMGMIMPIQKRINLLQWAQKTSSYIIEDDYDGEFRYQGQPIPSLKSLDTNDKVIYLGTFSKAFLPAARVTYMVLPQVLAERFQAEFFFYNQSVSSLIQEALHRFLQEGHFSRHIQKMRKIYHGKQKVLLESIESFLGDRARVIGQKAGLHILIEFKGIDARELVEKAEKSGVRIYLTEKYWMNVCQGASQPIILGYGGLKEEDIKLGIQKLACSLTECKDILFASN
ncbi:MocR-like pyridoxine biosynthesis transcription factor PdxR [Neobacillus ginsengisoli]|uniref:GntR family transcriptional regulator/MocR family aminotransferase n=1 Tax=Neobacillus ginsengisoli TaxID=904295 RepID=A0ABT9XXH8_9BACI|nr:PLP-dependent aminotransferase family protein [Neobacillus ginsengisoli]MDQ0200056.1 GntR family transcriptional regulator/MocR family aminotransferase [Neobacillus ginsengisoli]